MSNMTVVDSHLHVWRALAPDEAGPPNIVGPHEDVPIERALEVFDRHGVDRGVLVQPAFRGEDNHYIASCARERPDRLAAVCVVDPRTRGAADLLESWVVEHGCKGLRLRPRFPEESAVFGDAMSYPLWERAQKLGIAINVLANPEHLSTLGELAERFPKVPVVIDHLAHPHADAGVSSPAFQTLLDLSRQAQVFVKLSGYYHFTDSPEPHGNCWDLVAALFDRYGPERLIWGSDFPHVERRTGYSNSLELIRTRLPFLSDADRRLILGGNAVRLYWT